MEKNTMRLFGSIIYDDGKQRGYKGIKLSQSFGGKIEGGVSILFNSGRPVVDFIEYIKYISDKDNGVSYVGWSSSRDHFMMDGDRYTSAYVKHKKKVEKTKFMRQEDVYKLEDPVKRHNIFEKWTEYIVNRYIHSFEDLRRYYKRYRINPKKAKPFIVFKTKEEENKYCYDA